MTDFDEKLNEINTRLKQINADLRRIANKKRTKTMKMLLRRERKRLEKERESIIARMRREGNKGWGKDRSNSRARINKYTQEFLKWMEEPNSLDWRGTLEERKCLFANILGEKHIDNLKRRDVMEMLTYSWAESEWWSDKPWKAMKVLEKNGLVKLRKELKLLLYGNDPIEKRFDVFLTNIKGLGAAYTTEILTFIFPEKYCLWNRVAADVSIYLGINELLPYNLWKDKMKITGESYVKCCDVLQTLRRQLETCGLVKSNLIDVYHFIFYLNRSRISLLPIYM
jgi:hypothetical protein